MQDGGIAGDACNLAEELICERGSEPKIVQGTTIPRHRASHLLNLLQLTIEAILPTCADMPNQN